MAQGERNGGSLEEKSVKNSTAKIPARSKKYRTGGARVGKKKRGGSGARFATDPKERVRARLCVYVRSRARAIPQTNGTDVRPMDNTDERLTDSTDDYPETNGPATRV